MTSDRKFTSPDVVERELLRLSGLIDGIALDGRILPVEVVTLREWCASREAAGGSGGFREIVARLRAALADGVLDDAERDDLQWMCDRARSPSAYWTVARSDMERLQGVLAGIGADRRVTERELTLLRTLVEATRHLAGTWPYDEIDSVLTSVLADGKLDAEEERFLVAFTRTFLEGRRHLAGDTTFDEELVRHGACAARPKIEFRGRHFAITGTSAPSAQSEAARAVSRLGGVPFHNVRDDLDYLVVDAERNVSWAFSPHGRKVEEALALQEKGSPLTIVHATDFWAAADARGVRRPLT